MTSRQIKVLNNMACHNPTGRYSIVMGSEEVTLSVMSYDHITNKGHWTLSYLSYTVDLYSDMVISSFDSNVLRYMYDEYIKELKGSLTNTMSN